MAEIPTPETVALVRRLYVQGERVATIRARTGLSHAMLYRCLAGEFPDGTGVPPAPIPLRRAGMKITGRGNNRAALIARIWRTAERQVEEIEERAKAAGLKIEERESNARTLAIVVKTMRELAAFDEARKARSKEAAKDSHDNPAPRNIDDLRRDLARKLAAFAAEHADAVHGEDGSSGTRGP